MLSGKSYFRRKILLAAGPADKKEREEKTGKTSSPSERNFAAPGRGCTCITAAREERQACLSADMGKGEEGNQNCAAGEKKAFFTRKRSHADRKKRRKDPQRTAVCGRGFFRRKSPCDQAYRRKLPGGLRREGEDVEPLVAAGTRRQGRRKKGVCRTDLLPTEANPLRLFEKEKKGKRKKKK